MFSIKKLGAIGRTYRHLNRYQRILRVLFKYGFNDLVDRLFGGEALPLVEHLIAERKFTGDEIDKLRAIIDEHDATATKHAQPGKERGR